MFDLAVVHNDDLAPSQIIATLFDLSGVQVASGGQETVDLDFASAVMWDQMVDVSFAGDAIDDQIGVSVELENGSSEFSFGLHQNLTVDDVTLNFPDTTDLGLTGFEILVDGEAFGDESSARGCSLPFTENPTIISFEFAGAPLLTNPVDDMILTLAEIDSLAPAYTSGADGAFGANGPDLLSFDYVADLGNAPSGIDGASWTIFLRAGQDSLDLPLTGLPMFAEGLDGITVEIGSDRRGGDTFDYDSFFGADLAENVSAFLDDSAGSCESFSEIEISVEALP